MSGKPELGPALLQRVAALFKALAEPSRLALMSLLFDAERSVGELASASGLSLANVSKHLALLHRHGFVGRRKEGVTVHYRLADERARALCDLMCASVIERARGESALVAPARVRRVSARSRARGRSAS